MKEKIEEILIKHKLIIRIEDSVDNQPFVKTTTDAKAVEELLSLIQDEVKGFVKWNLKEDIKIQGSSLTLGASPEELLEARMERAERYLK